MKNTAKKQFWRYYQNYYLKLNSKSTNKNIDN